MASDSENSCGEPSAKRIKKQKYSQNYRKEWKLIPEFKGRLVESGKGKHFAKCDPCDKDININSGKDALIKHSSSKMHLLKVKAVKSNQPITNYMASTSTQVSHGKTVKKGNFVFIFFNYCVFYVYYFSGNTLGCFCS
jgi:hypothetical protein